jgi:hypothetical protein
MEMKRTNNHNLYVLDDRRNTEFLENVLQRHENKFLCQVCLKTFSSKHCLKEHGYTHSNLKPYKCRNCPKTFKHASQLSVHKKVHLNTYKPVWPKLTQMLSHPVLKEKIKDFDVEKVELPLIAAPQAWSLPKIIILE